MNRATLEKKMHYYQPEETMSFDQTHTLLYTFQYENAFAQLITTMGGNVSGGSTMQTDFDTGFTVPVDHELTKKHVLFYDDEDIGQPYREVGEVVFCYPNGETIEIDLEESANYLIKIEIIDYKLDCLQVTELRSLPVGSEITFAGRQWILLNPETGYVVMKDELTKKAFEPEDANNFNPSDLNNIGYYLNTMYYDTLTDLEKKAIQSHDWGVGGLSDTEGGYGLNDGLKATPSLTLTQMKEREDTAKVTANIGLLSVSDWRTYSKYIGQMSLNRLPTWLRTPDIDNPNHIWYVHPTGLVYYNNAYIASWAVQPALHLDSELQVDDGVICL